MKKTRWRKIIKVSKPLIREQVAKLDTLELWQAVGIGTCDYDEEECWDSLDNIFYIILKSTPKKVLTGPDFTSWKKSPEMYALEEKTDRSFEEEAECKNNPKSLN